jgi:hypothetical protein
LLLPLLHLVLQQELLWELPLPPPPSLIQPSLPLPLVRCNFYLPNSQPHPQLLKLNQLLPNQLLPNQPLLNQLLPNQPLLSQPLLSQPLLNQLLPNQPLLSQPLLSQPLLNLVTLNVHLLFQVQEVLTHQDTSLSQLLFNLEKMSTTLHMLTLPQLNGLGI